MCQHWKVKKEEEKTGFTPPLQSYKTAVNRFQSKCTHLNLRHVGRGAEVRSRTQRTQTGIRAALGRFSRIPQKYN